MSRDGFLTNQEFIDGLRNELDLEDTEQVFRYVFSRLGDEVVIYPSENFLYFSFAAQGRKVAGSLSLFAHNRNQGILGFGYSVRGHAKGSSRVLLEGGGKTFSQVDGLGVTKIDDFRYLVEYEGRTVTFRLHDVGMAPPRRARLRPEEEFVSPLLDESGLGFCLIFSRTEAHLFLILDEDVPVPEKFRSVREDIVLGERTGFAFFVDAQNRRKILVGVDGDNVLDNTWLDGPFDQMPDNNIHAGRIPMYQKYLEASYPGARGRIDRYGNYLDAKGTRIAVAPYLVYFSLDEVVARVDGCKRQRQAGPHLYGCLTEQVFRVPADRQLR